MKEHPPFLIKFLKTEDGSHPGYDFLESSPLKVRAKMKAALVAVSEAPPWRFSGGGMWEAMRGNLQGFYEIRVDEPGTRTHFRLFCLLEANVNRSSESYLVVLDGASKKRGTVLPSRRYEAIKSLGKYYWETDPRPVS